MPAVAKQLDAETIFGPGFQIQSKDGEYSLQFHDLTQIEGRFLGTGGQEPVNSTFLINRQWFMFSGRLTKPYEYFVSLAQGLDTITPLDVWMNVNYDDRLQFKMGRMFTPFAYEWFNVPTNALISSRALVVLQQLRPGPRHRGDGLGHTVRYPDRLRRRHLQWVPERDHRHQRLQGCRSPRSTSGPSCFGTIPGCST